MNTKQEAKMDQQVRYPLFMGYLPPEFIRKAEIELGETPEIRKQSVQEVRKLLRNERGIEDEWFSDDDIVMYLRCRKYRVQETLSTIKRMVSFVKSNRRIFEQLDPGVLKKCLDSGYSTFSPYRNKDGCTTAFVRLRSFNPSEVDVNDMMSFYTMSLFHTLKDAMSQINGLVLVCDLDAPILRYIRFFNPSFGYRIYRTSMECVPLRVKEIHIMKPSLFAKLVVSLMQALGLEKLSGRVFAHAGHQNLFYHLQSNVVPTDFGGEISLEDCKQDWITSAKMPDFITSILKSTK